MAKNEFVVVIEGTDMYLVGYNVGNPPQSTFGNIENAVIYNSLDAENSAAAAIGGGTIGTPK